MSTAYKIASNQPLYPSIEPYNTGMLKVSSIHSIYFEQCGNPDGIPVVYIHGGPGEAFTHRDRRYFDPEAYHIVLFDQRGVGKSTPAFCLEDNDTWALVDDMEKLRKHLGIEKWLLFGGSWGSTLALLYAETHIERVLGLVMSGIYLSRKEDNVWFNQVGASVLFPDYWQMYLDAIPVEEHGDLLGAYYKRFLAEDGDNDEARQRCVKAWMAWEEATCVMDADPKDVANVSTDAAALGYCRIESHYLVKDGFLPSDNYILENVGIIADAGIPVTIVRGRFDVVCPGTGAWALHERLKNADFHIVWDAGHEEYEPGTTKLLVEACDRLKILLRK